MRMGRHPGTPVARAMRNTSVITTQLAPVALPLRPTYREQTIDLPGRVSLSYVEHGDPTGLPVVFLHGWSDSWRSFEPLLPQLPPEIRAIALSLRGHSESSRPETGYGTGDFAADVVGFLDAMEIESAVIVGHSMGSTIALRLAVDEPEHVSGLVLMGAIRTWKRIIDVRELRAAAHTLVDPVDPEFVRDFQLGTISRPVTPWYVDLVVDESLKLPARVWQSVIESFLPDRTYTRIELIDASALLIWGDQDAVTPRSEQVILRETIPDARLVVYPGTGHAVHWEQPERIASDLLDFIDRLER